MAQSEPITTCARHPKVETNLRCASCGTPICPKCLVQTPVGMKCRECGTQRGGVLFTLSPGQAASALAVGLLFGVVAGWADASSRKTTSSDPHGGNSSGSIVRPSASV